MTLRSAILTGLLATFGGGAAVEAAPLLLLQSRWDEAAVVRSFRSVVGRNPYPVELRRYALLMDRYGWTEADVRRDLQERTDYRTYAQSRFDVDQVIRRAYRDILDREPDAAGYRSYRQHIVNEGWSERDVREALRRSPEYNDASRRNASADRIVRRAYNDILHREPDPEGLAGYRRAILEDGWDEHDVRQALRRSDERQALRGEQRGQRRAYAQAEADAIVRSAYLRILRREPDAAGLRDYGQRVRQDGWTQADVERALLDSDEYRTKFGRR